MAASARAGRPLVVITDQRHGSIAEEEAVFRPLGAELRVAACSSESDVAEACAEADAVLLNMAPMGASAIAALRRCRVISRYGVGLDNVDLAAAAARGIAVRAVPGYCDHEVAEHALALLLALCRGIPERDAAVRNGGWNLARPQRSLRGSTIGVVGFGGSGRAFARKALAFEPARALVWSPRIDRDRVEAALGPAAAAFGVEARAATLDEILAESDALSLHLRLCDDTRGFMDAARLGRMKRGAFLINCARGALVDEAALAAALREGRLAGAGLDVFAAEPPTGSPLLSLAEIVVTDHSAYRSDRSLSELKRRCALNAAEALGLGKWEG